MAAHRYWGIEGFARSGSGLLGVSEVQMRATPGGADQCVGGTAFASSVNGSATADKAFDDNNSTEWQGTASTLTPARLWYDFGSPVSVQEIVYRASGVNVLYAGAWVRVLFSDDGTKWYVGSGGFEAGGLALNETLVAGGISDVGPTAYGLPGLGAFAPSAPAWPVEVRALSPLARLRRVHYGGLGKIEGTVKIKGTPNYAVRRKVYLLRDRDLVVVDEQWSDATTGAYSFVGFDPAEKYTVISYDHTHAFRAVIADNLTPEAM